ncbi:hypothetical protein AAFF_G00234240 [Aldrovandia affinis]|uniref:Transposase n=1 Tax=Aldrovandia affinis TaxID=143900 RepID=A0AAD7WTT9_9TELE|nr:hypothetical protein AAFF_G00234240 [Aldrovandia affinis]
MTCHCIEENNLEKKSAALACARIRGRHTYNIIAAKIHDIHVAFSIENKVQSTVTDNGSNFVKDFQEFAQSEEDEGGDQDDNDTARFEDVSTILEREGGDK